MSSVEPDVTPAPDGGQYDAPVTVLPGAEFDSARHWQTLRSATSEADGGDAWLELQCRAIAGAVCGVLVLGRAETGPFQPQASWPGKAQPDTRLAQPAELALAERRGIVQAVAATSGQAGGHAVAWPLQLDGRLHGVAAVLVDAGPEADLRPIMRQLQWGAAGLEGLIRRGEKNVRSGLVTVLDLVTTCVEQPRSRAAATAVANELTSQFDCDWTAIGYRDGRHCTVGAMSHSATVGEKSNVVRAIAAAMDEAIDQGDVVVYPKAEEARPQAQQAHAELARLLGTAALCSVPIMRGTQVLGAWMLARDVERPWSADECALATRAAVLAGPILDVKRRDDRWLPGKALESLRTQLGRLFGPRFIGRKLALVALLALVAWLWQAEDVLRVQAEATLEGAQQRTLAAPIDGYVARAAASAGDVVQAGDVLAELDERDLRLQRLKWANLIDQRGREYNKALAEHDWAGVRIVGAVVEQAQAELALLDEQLARTRVIAPFDGVIVSGDLRQSLSAPVARGDVLFVLALLDDYRVVLEVDERDISRVSAGQRGHLTLAALPDTVHEFEVVKVTPVSRPADGRNRFRVEAQLEGDYQHLRPGMQGVGKVDIETRKRAYIWTYKLVHWLRMTAWSLWA